jgi:RNA polymerase sigma factor (TIGR02999 family)
MSSDVTTLIRAWSAGDAEAGQQVISVVYSELRKLAAHYLRDQNGEASLQPTGLVHELYIKLFSGEAVNFNDRQHFMATAARQLRNFMVDHARRRQAQKRWGGQKPVNLGDVDVAGRPLDESVVELHELLTEFEKLDPRAAQVVEYRYFGGFTEAETAELLGITPARARRDFDIARSWLAARMTAKPGDPPRE